MYRQDVTELLTPSTASPGAAVEAAKLKGSAAQQVIGLAETAYNMKKEYDFTSTVEEARAARDEFFDKNRAKDMADARKLELVGQLKKEVSIFESGMETGEQEDAQRKKISELNIELTRLRDSKDFGGMSAQAYYDKVRSITKKSIVNYPGLADEIRKAVGAVTGFKYADEDPQMQYVREKLDWNKPDGGSKVAEWALKEDIKGASDMGFATSEELLKMYSEDKPMYDSIMTMYKSSKKTEAASKVLKANAEAIQVRDEQTANELSTLVGTAADATAMTYYANFLGRRMPEIKKFETQFRSMESKGYDLASLPELDQQVQLFMADASTEVKRAYDEAEKALIRKLDEAGIHVGTVRNNIMEEFNRKRKNALELMNPTGDDKGTALLKRSAYIKVLMADRKRGLDENIQLMNVAGNLIDAFGKNVVATDYIAANEAQKELIRKQYPQMAEAIDSALAIMRSGGMNFITAVTKGIMPVGEGAANANETPGATPTEKYKDPKEQKAAVQSANAKVLQILYNITARPTDPQVTQGENVPNQISTISGNVMRFGSSVKEYIRQYPTIRNILDSLTPTEKGIVFNHAQNDYNMAFSMLKDAWEKAGKPKFVLTAQGAVELEGDFLSSQKKLFTDPNSQRQNDFIRAYKPVIDGMIAGRSVLAGVPFDVSARALSEELKRGATTNMFDVGDLAGKTSTSIGKVATGKVTQAETINYKTEKALPDAVKQGIEDLKTELESKKALLADIREGTPTYERTSQDIKDIEKELKRYTKGK